MIKSILTCKRVGVTVSYLIVSFLSACEGDLSQPIEFTPTYFKDRFFSCTTSRSNIPENIESDIYFHGGGLVWTRPASEDGEITSTSWQQIGAWTFDDLNTTIDILGDQLPPFSIAINGISASDGETTMICTPSSLACNP